VNIVLDSNIIFGNWYLTGPNITILQEHMKLGASKLIIPEIVVMEVENLFKEEIIKYEQPVKELNNLLSGISQKLEYDIDKIMELYKKALTKRLKALRAEIPTYSDISHENVANRALSKRKPFAKSGKGYMDTLIWETILRKVADSKDETFIITNNHKDFASEEDKEKLHPDLLNDLITNHLPPESVRLYTDIKSFIDDKILPHLKQIEDVIKELGTGRYKSFSIGEWFEDNREGIIMSGNKYIENVISDPELEDPRISYIEDPEEITVNDVRLADDNTAYVEVTLTANAVIDVFVFKGSYYSLSDRYPIEIQEFDWNEHYVWAQLEVDLPVSLSLIFDLKEEKVREFEVNPFGEIYGFCRRCGATILSDAAETCSKCGKSLFPHGDSD
jgi:hypothetical protein